MPFFPTDIQRLGFLGAGSLRSAGAVEIAVAVLVELVVVVVFVPVLEVVEEAVVSDAESSGTPGLGHVASCASSGQNSLILLEGTTGNWQRVQE